MCGIVGYVGKRRAAPILYGGLCKLEYRGYDSAGIATLSNGFHIEKCAGRVKGLLQAKSLEGHVGIGHTRWATHGGATKENAHPHRYGRFVIVHNGIIENYKQLKAECEARKEQFNSETDSEVVAHLLEYFYDGDLLSALRRTTALLEGSFGLAVLCDCEEDTVALAKNKSPLVVGVGENECYCASDISAIAKRGMRFGVLGDGEFAIVKSNGVKFYDAQGEIQKELTACSCSSVAPELGTYRHFMQKEMAEIPQAIANVRPDFGRRESSEALSDALFDAKHIVITGCGTAYHAALAAKYAFEGLARVSASAEIASEYRYRNPLIGKDDVMIAVSQSGETADTLAAAQLAKERGAKIVAVVNEELSALTAIADFVLPVKSGKEVAVAATKSFNAQLCALYSIAAHLAELHGIRGYGCAIAELASLARQTLLRSERVKDWVKYFVSARSVYFIGRGADYVAALEGSLKLKEISYLPSEGYPAGELKHGTLALVEENTPVVAVLTARRLAEKTMNAVHETCARGAKVFLVTSIAEYASAKGVCDSVVIPDNMEYFMPALSVIPLQKLAYYVCLARGNDPDHPRNLAKSVTVE